MKRNKLYILALSILVMVVGYGIRKFFEDRRLPDVSTPRINLSSNNVDQQVNAYRPSRKSTRNASRWRFASDDPFVDASSTSPSPLDVVQATPQDTESKSEKSTALEIDKTTLMTEADYATLADRLQGAIIAKEDGIGLYLKQLVDGGDKSVAELARLLEIGPGSEVQEYAAIGLAEVGTPNSVSILLSFISDTRDPVLRRNSCKILERVTNPAAVPILMKALSGAKEKDLVRGVGRSLALIGTSQAVGGLVSAANNNRSELVRHMAIDAIRSVRNEAAVDSLGKIVVAMEGSSEIRHSCADALGSIGTKKASYALLRAVGNTNSEEDAEVIANALGQVSRQESYSLLSSTLLSETATYYQRVGTATSLSHDTFESGLVLEVLREALLSEDNEHVKMAINNSISLIEERRHALNTEEKNF